MLPKQQLAGLKRSNQLVIQRLRISLEYLETYNPEQFIDSANKEISVPMGGGEIIIRLD